MSDIAVSVNGLGKRYRIAHKRDPYGRLTESLAAAMRAPFDRLRGAPRDTGEWIWALRDVSFELRQGDIVGVIGRNGAGKTTLLKVLSRITEPTSGSADLHGRVGSLLEVGTGFHPELTGRENIYMSAAILGMRRREINRKFDEIVDFAGTEQFLDTPVKRYSSGMQVRLGFAVAAHLETEILFVDEVLAVGDLTFQEKCLGKMGEVAEQGRTVLFVSHNMSAISRLCPMSLWLDGGELRGAGKTVDIVPMYVRSPGQNLDSGEVIIDPDERREAQVSRARILSASGAVMPVGECSESLTIELLLEVRRRLHGLYGYLEVRLPDGLTVLFSDSLDTDPNPLDDLPVGQYIVTARIPPRTLAPGKYDVYVSLYRLAGTGLLVHDPGIVASFRLHDFSTPRGDSRRGFFSTLLQWQATGVSREDE